MSFANIKEKNNTVWEERIERAEEQIEKIYLKMAEDEKQIEDEMNRLKKKHDNWVDKNLERYVKSTIEKTRNKQQDRFDAEVGKRYDKLNENLDNLQDNLTLLVEKKQKQLNKHEGDIERYKNHMNYTDGPRVCKDCDFTYYNDFQKKKHEEGLVHKLNAGIIPPIPNGLTCLCGTQFTQYHGIKEKNDEFMDCYINCSQNQSFIKKSTEEELFDKLDYKLEPIQILRRNQRQIFQYLGILNDRNTLTQMVSRLEEAWEYEFGEVRSITPNEDIRKMYLLNEERNNIYSIDLQGNQTDLCTIIPIMEEEEINMFGEGLTLQLAYRKRVPLDLRDRNPSIKMAKSNLLRDRPLSKEEYNDLRIGKPLEKGERNIYDLENETIEERKVLQNVLKETPENKKVTRTTTTTTN